MTEQEIIEAKQILGPAAEDFDSDMLSSALVVYARASTRNAVGLARDNKALNEQVVELSAANDELSSQVIELSASQTAGPDVIELSAGELEARTELVTHKIDAVADKQKWPTAYRNKVAAVLAAPGVITLSAGTGDEAPAIDPAVFLDLLAERPGIGLQPGEKTGRTAITHLSQATDTDPTPVAKSDDTGAPSGKNPWDDEIARIEAEAKRASGR